MSKRKTHGEHNKSLSLELLKGEKYFDWVITTAFYSAIHIVEDKILPCQINGRSCTNINEVKRAFRTNGRHAAREDLVQLKMLEIATKYKWLDDQSRYSRYISYKVNKTQAEKATQYLKEILVACYK